jgi:hypothetical protein
MRRVILAVLVLAARTLPAAEPAGFDAAAAFGARPSVTALTISPDGQNVAWIAADAAAGAALYTLSLAPGAKPHGALHSSGKPERLESCNWVSNDRLVCRADWLQHRQGGPAAAQRRLPAQGLRLVTLNAARNAGENSAAVAPVS